MPVRLGLEEALGVALAVVVLRGDRDAEEVAVKELLAVAVAQPLSVARAEGEEAADRVAVNVTVLDTKVGRGESVPKIVGSGVEVLVALGRVLSVPTRDAVGEEVRDLAAELEAEGEGVWLGVALPELLTLALFANTVPVGEAVGERVAVGVAPEVLVEVELRENSPEATALAVPDPVLLGLELEEREAAGEVEEDVLSDTSKGVPVLEGVGVLLLSVTLLNVSLGEELWAAERLGMLIVGSAEGVGKDVREAQEVENSEAVGANVTEVRSVESEEGVGAGESVDEGATEALDMEELLGADAVASTLFKALWEATLEKETVVFGESV